MTTTNTTPSTTPELTAEQRFQKKINLTRKLAMADWHFEEQIRELQNMLEQIEMLPADCTFLRTDADGVKGVVVKITAGTKDVSDETFGQDGEFIIEYRVTTTMLEAKINKIQEERNAGRETLKALLAPEMLPQFNPVVI